MVIKRIKIPVILVSLAIASCHTSQREKERATSSQKNNSQPEYPAIVDSLGVQKLYNETKWRMYLLVCDDTPMLRNGKYLFSPPKTFGALNLKFDSLWQRNDSIAFYFDFYVNDTLSLYKIRMSLYPRNMKVEYYNGMIFSKNDTLTTCYVSNHGYFAIECTGPLPKEYYDTTTNKYLKPLQPDIIKYIQANKDLLNPWFRKEAEKRGIIR